MYTCLLLLCGVASTVALAPDSLPANTNANNDTDTDTNANDNTNTVPHAGVSIANLRTEYVDA